MTDKDYAISPTGVPQVGHISKKPRYLISLDEVSGKSKSTRYFISLDMPNLLNGFIQVKGFFVALSENEAVSQFQDIIDSTPKEHIMDMMFPWHKINSIRSLVFNANKTSTLVK